MFCIPGHLTDSHGRKVDFRNTVIIMTSNLGAHGIAAAAVRADSCIRVYVLTSLS